MYWINKHFRS